MERTEAHDRRSPPLLGTIFHYSIPVGMLGRGPHTLSMACRRRLTAYASLQLSAAPDAQRSVSQEMTHAPMESTSDAPDLLECQWQSYQPWQAEPSVAPTVP